jgi:hypothetical protein
MKFSKSVIDRLVFVDVDYLEKASMVSKPSGNTRITQFSRPFKNVSEVKGKKSGNTLRQYTYDADRQEVEVDKRTKAGKGGNYKDIPATAAHEKELKNASVFLTFDAILEKGRKRESDRSAPKRVEESEGEGLELPGGSMATMGNPGGSKEKASFERAEPGAIRNLKKLAQSPNKMDRKAAEAGMKRH